LTCHTRSSSSRGNGQAGSGRKPVWVPSNGKSPASINLTSRSPSDQIASAAALSNLIDRFDEQVAGGPARPAEVVQPRWSPARLAYWFYAVAASGAVIGQTWVAVTHVPWPPGMPGVVRVLAVLLFALCLELLAMALSAMADERMRMGERAHGFRFFSP
jgi:hypothetical protein